MINLQLLETKLNATPAVKAAQNIKALEHLAELREDLSISPNLDILAAFSGWGALHQVFDPIATEQTNLWTGRTQAALKKLLTPNLYQKALASILNAHYTSPEVIRNCWQILSNIGFEGGRILEPSCGTGLWKLFQPQALSINSQWFGVENDTMPATIAHYVFKHGSQAHNQVFNQGFETITFPDGYFDAVIGNVPFGAYSLHESRYNPLSLYIHNHFLAKSMDLVRPGGLVALITSTGTLDRPSSIEFRRWLAQRGELVAALRLPSGAFSKIANTEVSTDFLIFRRYAPDAKKYLDPRWIKTEEIEIEGKTLPINGYYKASPDHVLGQLVVDTMYGGQDRIGVKPHNNYSLSASFGQILKIKKSIYQSGERTEVDYLLPAHMYGLPKNTFVLWEGDYWQIGDAQLKPVPSILVPIVVRLLKLHATVNELLELQKGYDEAGLILARKELAKAYDVFVTHHNKLNSRKNRKTFKHCPQFIALTGLEKEDGSRADIFYKRTATPEPELIAATPRDALYLSLNTRRFVDLPWMGQLTGQTENELVEALRTERLLHHEQNGWVTTDEFVAGNTKAKLVYLEDNATSEADYLDMELLKAHLPLPLLPPASAEIKATCLQGLGLNLEEYSEEVLLKIFDNTLELRFGATWIPGEYYKQFLLELAEATDLPTTSKFQINYLLGNWIFAIPKDAIYRQTTAVKSKWSTLTMDLYDLAQIGLNLKDPAEFYKDSDGKTHVDLVRSAANRALLFKIKAEFDKWVWKDVERAVALTNLYNQLYNQVNPRKFDGQHLNFPGSNPNVSPPRIHQKNAVWQAILQSAVLFGHEVGLGKTRIMIYAAMEARRLGLAKKPMLVALNSTLSDMEIAARTLYPCAKILCGDEKSFQKENRQEFISLMALGDWDLIIIPSSTFFYLQLSTSTQIDYQDSLLEELRLLEEEAEKDEQCQKAVARMINKIQQRINKIRYSPRKDHIIDWELIGVDMLMLDEWQQYKNLYNPTKQYHVAGLTNTESQRALDTIMKVFHVLNRNGKVILSTGTPLSNSIAELYTIMRNLYSSETLKDYALGSFDAFCAQFTHTESAPEITATGKFKTKTRVREFINIPELMKILGDAIDLQMASMHPDIVRPHPFNHLVKSPSIDLTQQLVVELARRADLVNGGMVDKQIDNMLVITNDGKKLSLDPRLVCADAPEDPTYKVHEAARIIYQVWKETRHIKATQLVFCDLATPRKDDKFDVYRYLRLLLVAMGMPAEQIQFIHEHDTKAKKKALFAKTNAGEVSVLVGSSGKLGTGVNVQERVIAMHRLDCPYRPVEVIQSEGRGIRQGNMFPGILVFRYITEGANSYAGFDSFLWQKLETKIRFIIQFMTGNLNSRKAEDIGRVVLDYAQIKSAASGSPLLEEKAQLDLELKHLSLLYEANDQRKYLLKHQVFREEAYLDKLPITIATAQSDLDACAGLTMDNLPAFFQGEPVSHKFLFQELWSVGKNLSSHHQVDVNARLGPFKISVKQGRKDEFTITYTNQRSYEHTLFWETQRNLSVFFDHLLPRIKFLIHKSKEEIPESEAMLRSFLKQLSAMSFEEQERFDFVKDRLSEINYQINQEAAADVPTPKDKDSADPVDDTATVESNAEEDEIEISSGFTFLAELRPPSAKLVELLASRIPTAADGWFTDLQSILSGLPLEIHAPVTSEQLELEPETIAPTAQEFELFRSLLTPTITVGNKKGRKKEIPVDPGQMTLLDVFATL